MTPEELIAYFKGRDLPATLSLQGQTIANCSTYVKANTLRLEEGVPLIKKTAADALERFKEVLETKKPNQ
ncbi:MAG: DUF6965 family protein [Agriterribacter sp.]